MRSFSDLGRVITEILRRLRTNMVMPAARTSTEVITIAAMAPGFIVGQGTEAPSQQSLRVSVSDLSRLDASWS